MFAVELLANSAVANVTLELLHCFEHADHFRISQFTYQLRYYIIAIDHS